MRACYTSLYRLDCRWTMEVGRRSYTLADASTGIDEMATTIDIEGIKTQGFYHQTDTHPSTRLRRRIIESNYGNSTSSVMSDPALIVDTGANLPTATHQRAGKAVSPGCLDAMDTAAIEFSRQGPNATVPREASHTIRGHSDLAERLDRTVSSK